MIGLPYVELLLRAANVQAVSDDTYAESGPLHRLVSYPDWKRRSLSLLGWRFLSNAEISSNFFVAVIPQENNVHNHTVHNFFCA